MKPVIDHIQITVKDLKTAELFYDQLLPILGFDLSRKKKGRVPAHEIEVVEYFHPALKSVSEIKVFDIIGKELLSQTVSGNKSEIDVHFLSGGIYFLQLKAEHGFTIKKFIKE